MEIKSDWPAIRRHFNKSFSTNFHVSIASVDHENNPLITPIGSLFLRKEQRGFYFEKYPSKLPANAAQHPSICVLAVNSGVLFWLKSLFMGRFVSYPAIKLYGRLGQRRTATEDELSKLQKRMSITKTLKGNHYLWGEMSIVREVFFERVEVVRFGKMTDHL
jgi:hypothetical protein